MTDSRSSCLSYLLAKPPKVRTLVAALGAGLLAIYVPMIIVALFGVWGNNLFRWNTNWPWAFPLAAFNLVSPRKSVAIALHALVFGLMCVWHIFGIVAYLAQAPMHRSLYAVVFIDFATPIINILAYVRISHVLQLGAWPKLFSGPARV